jgi:myo-inositol-1(or 4)-monophosphatase
VRRTGSAALNMAYVAAGRFDAFWGMTTKAWDIAAGWLIIEEAGGVCSLIDGRPLTLADPHPVSSATPELHSAFQKLMQTSHGRLPGTR